MDFITAMYALPNTLLFIFIFLILAFISIVCLIVVEKFVLIKLRYDENNSIGYVGGTIGIIYAVLAGFILFYVMDNFQKASDTTRNESASAAKIYRNAIRLPADEKNKIQTAMRQYVSNVINIEWPRLTHEEVADGGEKILDKLMTELNQYVPKNNQDLFALQDMYNELNDLYKNRDTRIDLSMAALPGDLWTLILISTFLTLMVKSLNGMKLGLHIALQGVVTLMLTTVLFLIIVLDRPFRGHFSITSLPFQEIYEDMRNSSIAGAELLRHNQR